MAEILKRLSHEKINEIRSDTLLNKLIYCTLFTSKYIRMIKKISFSLFLFIHTNLIIAQTKMTNPTPNYTITGYVDGYFGYDFTKSINQSNNYTSFTHVKNKVALGMASIKVDKSMGKFEGTIDLGFGKRAEEFSYNDKGFLSLIKQAFLSYSVSDRLKITAGKWGTHVGYELLDAPLNRTYSMSYGFSYGPFFHTGVKADYALSGKSSLMIGIANPSDFVSTSSTSKVIIAQFSTKLFKDITSVYVNFLGGNTGGDHNFNQFDVVINNAVSTKWAINYNGTLYATSNNGKKSAWKSNAVYINYDYSSKIGLTYRSEYFDDKKALTAVPTGASIFANTLSLNYKYKKCILLPEIRIDNAKTNIFYTSNGNPTGKKTSFVLAFIYKL